MPSVLPGPNSPRVAEGRVLQLTEREDESRGAAEVYVLI